MGKEKMSRRDFLKIAWGITKTMGPAVVLAACTPQEKAPPANPTLPPTNPAPTEISPTPETIATKPPDTITKVDLTASAEAPPTPETPVVAPTKWEDWNFKLSYSLGDMSERRTELILKTQKTEEELKAANALKLPSRLEDMQGNLIAKFWSEGILKETDSEGNEVIATNWTNAETAFYTKYKFEYGIEERTDLFRWTVLVKNKFTDELIYAGDEHGVPSTQLGPFLKTRMDSFSIHKNNKSEEKEKQVIVNSNNGEYFTIVTLDEDNNPIEWMDLNTGKMVEIEAVEKYEGAKDIENYADNPLTPEDFEKSGKVDTFFEEIKPEIMAKIEKIGWDNIKDDIPFANLGGFITYSPSKEKKPQFEDTQSIFSDTKNTEGTQYNPFIRDFDAFGEIIATFDGVEHRYIFMPLIIIDKDKKDIYFVKLAFPLQRDGVPLSNPQGSAKTWETEMAVSPIGKEDKPKFATDKDPLFFPQVNERKGEVEAVFNEWRNKDPVHGNLGVIRNIDDLIFCTTIASSDYIYK